MCHKLTNHNIFVVFLFFILAVAVNSCRGHRLSQELSEIDVLISECPDSALTIIDSFDTLSLKNTGLKAEYALLKAKCLDKNSIDNGAFLDHLRKYESYFFLHSSVEKRVEFGYYLADLYFDAGEYEEASIGFLETLDNAIKIEDWFYAGQSSWSLALIYLKTFSYVEELKYIEQSCVYFRKGGFGYYADYAEVQLAEALLKNGNIRKSQETYDDVIAKAQVAKDSTMLGYVLTGSALSLLSGDSADPEKVIERMAEAVRINYPLNSRDYGNLATAYHLLGKDRESLESIDKAFRELPSNPKTRMYVSSSAYEIYKDAGMLDKALELAETLLHYQDSSTVKILGQSVVKAQLKYSQEKEKVAATKLSQSNVVFFISVALLVALVCIVVLISKVRRNRLELEYNRKIQQYTLSISELKSSIDSLIRMGDGSKNDQTALRFTFSAFDSLFDEYYHSPGNEDAALLASFESIIERFRNDTAFIASFESMVDTAHNGIVTIAGKECKLKDSDLYLFTFMVAEMSYPTICVILDVNLPAVYNRVKRLRSRIMESDSEHKDAIMRYLANRTPKKTRKVS